jgi:hypothetical protein
MRHEPTGATGECEDERAAHAHAMARAEQTQHEHSQQIHVLHIGLPTALRLNCRFLSSVASRHAQF